MKMELSKLLNEHELELLRTIEIFSWYKYMTTFKTFVFLLNYLCLVYEKQRTRTTGNGKWPLLIRIGDW